MVFFEILEANLKVKFASTGNDVLTRFFHRDLDHRVRFGETLEAFDELWEVRWVLAFDSDTDDWRHGELHHLDVVGTFPRCDGSGLHEELVNTDETADVAGWARFNGLDVSPHHQVDTLDLLEEQIVLLARNVVRAHNSDLGGGHGAGVHTAESVETALVVGWDHLRHVHHQDACRVAVLHRHARLVVGWAFVEVLGTVLTGGDRGRQVNRDHLQQSVASWEPLSDHGLHQRLAFEFGFVLRELDFELGDELGGLFLVKVHHGIKEGEDWRQDELAVATGVAVATALVPLTGLCVVELVTPESLHELGDLDLELGRVHFGKLLQGVRPAVEAGTETNRAVFRRDLDFAHWTIVVTVGGDDDVDVFDDTLEGLVQVFLFELEFEQRTVHLVQEEDWLDTLADGLSKDSLGLDANAGDAVDNNEGTVGDTECGGDFRRKVNVARRVNQVDQESRAVLNLVDVLQVIFWQLVVQGDGGRLDGNGTILLVLTGVHETGFASLCACDDTGFTDEGVSKGRFAVIDVGNHGHVPDVGPTVHDLTDLVYGKVHLEKKREGGDGKGWDGRQGAHDYLGQLIGWRRGEGEGGVGRRGRERRRGGGGTARRIRTVENGVKK